MAHEGFPKNAITTQVASGLTYTSVFFPKPADSDKTTILFLHGFPSSSWDWYNQINHFSRNGYGVIAPDLLGYGGTSSPSSLIPYAFKVMADDIISLLRHCNVDIDGGEKVHIVAHDFGSVFLGTLLGYYPNIALTATFLAVPYAPPGQKVDMDVMKAITEKVFGFELFGYRRFLWRDDSWTILRDHKESFFTLVNGPAELEKTDFLPPGRLEAWLAADKKAPLQPWVTPEYRETRDRIFADDLAFLGPTNWYRARFRDFVGKDVEKRDLGEGVKIACPAMFVQSKGGMVGEDPTKGFATTYIYKEVAGAKGHFCQLEAPEEVNRILEEFFRKYRGGEVEKLKENL